MIQTLTEPESRQAMRNLIMAQCFGTLSLLLFTNGFLLAYLSAVGIPSEHILSWLTLPYVSNFLLMLPFAHLADRIGRKRVGLAGLYATVAGFALIATFTLLPGHLAVPLFLAGAIIFSTGYTAFSSSWFALLSPIIPAPMRGRFFGRLRTSWQAVAIAFSFIVTVVLRNHPEIGVYRLFLLVVLVMAFARILIYQRIPDLEPPNPSRPAFLEAIGIVFHTPGYLAFGAYIFLLYLFTGAAPWLMGLLQKDTMGLTGDSIVLLGNALAVGTFIGFIFAGRLVDRFGTKPAFMINHFAYALILGLIPLRPWFSASPLLYMGCLMFGFGICNAVTSVSISTEMLGIMPARSRSLSTALISMLSGAGIALSGQFAAQAIRLRMLADQWMLAGRSLGPYDTLLMASGIMVLLLVVTLGLIPSVLRPAEYSSNQP